MNLEWRRVSEPPPLDRRSIHIWRFDLERSPLRLDQLSEHLTGDERARAERFYRAVHGARFTAARGLLRHVLGLYLGEHPSEVDFVYEEKGKPFLPLDRNPEGVTFNLTHSHQYALVAVASRVEIGVDIEQIRDTRDLEGIAERFYSEPEKECLRNADETHRLDLFYRYWCRKEAFLKARGDGLSFPLNRFDVSKGPAVLVTLLDDSSTASDHSVWSYRDLDPVPGFAAAVCFEGADVEMRGFELAYG